MEIEVQKIAAKLTASKAAMRELSEGVTSARDHIRRLKAGRRQVSASIVTQETAFERLEKWFDAISREATILAPDPSRFVGAEDWTYPGAQFPQTQAAMLMVHLAPQVIESAKERLTEFYADKEPISEPERLARLALIDRHILDTELAEEGLIRAAEAEGFVIMRRPDANVFAVLAHDEVFA